MRTTRSGLPGLPGLPLLPSRKNDVPVSASELRELLSWTLNPPADGAWEKETVSDLTVHRLTETDEARPGLPVERARCEVTLDAPIETVYALVDDPRQRAKWDDVVGQSMKKYKSQGHSFVSFRLEGLMGLAAEDFLLWDAQQAYDRNLGECEANALWSFVILWQPAAVSREGVPPHEGCFKPAAFGTGMVRDSRQPKSKTKVVAMARVQLSSSMLQYFLPSLMRSMLSSQSQRLLDRIGELNANVDERKAVHELGVRGLQKISSPTSASVSMPVPKSSADKVDAFLLDMPGGQPQEATAKAGGTKSLPPQKSAPEPPEAATPADFPMASASRTSVTDMPQAGLKPEAQQPETSAITEMDTGPKPGSDTSFFSARSTTPAEPPEQPEQPERESFVRVGPLPSAKPFRRKLELPSGLQDEATKLGVSMTLGLGTLKQGLEGGPSATSSTSLQEVDSDESLRLRLGKMQSKWLQDVSEVKASDFQDPKVPKENELKKLRGTNSWLLQLMREASDAEFLPPPWRPKTGPGGTEAAEELPPQI
eukprot:s1043_g27.t1